MLEVSIHLLFVRAFVLQTDPTFGFLPGMLSISHSFLIDVILAAVVLAHFSYIVLMVSDCAFSEATFCAYYSADLNLLSHLPFIWWCYILTFLAPWHYSPSDWLMVFCSSDFAGSRRNRIRRLSLRTLCVIARINQSLNRRSFWHFERRYLGLLVKFYYCFSQMRCLWALPGTLLTLFFCNAVPSRLQLLSASMWHTLTLSQ